MPQVSLVQMPYAAIERPSLALGILKASLDRVGVSSSIKYPNLRFAEDIGMELFQAINSFPFNILLGEWTFAGAAFPEWEPLHEEFFELPLVKGELAVGGMRNDWLMDEAKPGETVREVLFRLRESAVVFVDKIARELLAEGPKIVGCTSTFQQHCAALALLRRVKELDPSVVTMLGGANCEGPMGASAHRNFRWVDFLVSGEADLLFPELVQKILDQGRDIPIEELPYGAFGPATREQAADLDELPRVVLKQMDMVPIPEFTDYFESMAESKIQKYIVPGLPVELARGCWWGAKSHCTFCGLNGSGMGFRSKSAERVVEELDTLSERHQITDFDVVDNILDMGYFKTVVPELASREDKYFTFFETKSNLKKQQLAQLAEAGIRYIQPGIESLHQGPLDLIGKGCTPMTNVRILKWGLEYGIRIEWLFLHDFPREEDAWYEEMADWISQIYHFNNPSTITPIQFHRFSPYHFRGEEYGLSLDPEVSYPYVYPLPEDEMRDLAYYFDDTAYRAEVSAQEQPGKAALHQAVLRWRSAWVVGNFSADRSYPKLEYGLDEQGTWQVVDTRPCAVEREHSLSVLQTAAMIACDGPVSEKRIAAEVGKVLGETVDADALTRTLETLTQAKLLLHLDGQYLGLVVPASRPDLPDRFPGGTVAIRAYLRDRVLSKAEKKQSSVPFLDWSPTPVSA